jgi:hypothetical protein
MPFALNARLGPGGGWVKALYLDESGDHNLAVIDPQYPLFVLGGVIMEQRYAESELPRELDAFKRGLFGRTDLVLHTADIVRNRNGFEEMKDAAFRARFLESLNALMLRLRYTVVACAIRKTHHLSRYGESAADPYLMGLDVLVERFCFEVGSIRAGGVMVAERRGPELDARLDRAWEQLKRRGTRYVGAGDIGGRITGLDLRAKAENVPGLQLADLVVSPIGRHVLGKPDREDWNIVRSKLRCGPRGTTDGYGLVVLPRIQKAGPRYAVASPQQ